MFCLLGLFLGENIRNYESPESSRGVCNFVTFHHELHNTKDGPQGEYRILSSLKLLFTIIEIYKDSHNGFRFSNFHMQQDYPGEFVKKRFLGTHPQFSLNSCGSGSRHLYIQEVIQWILIQWSLDHILR